MIGNTVRNTFGTRSLGRWNRHQTRPDQTRLFVAVVCGVSNSNSIASNGDLDAASCNATDAIEHLDFHPNCSSDKHERRALWICRVIERPCDCGPTVVLACGPCYAWYNPPGIWRWHCTDCDLPLALAWEPLC